jgi:hypothetical protein
MTHPEPAMVDTVKYKPERMLGELDELARTINVVHLEIQFFVSDPLMAWINAQGTGFTGSVIVASINIFMLHFHYLI